jgi:predicted alpha/beta-fold hydrolase
MWLSFVLSYEPRVGTFLFGGEDLPMIQEGLYYDHGNRLMRTIAENWPVELRTYSKEYGATPWMPTGDSRTGLPFLLNKVDKPEWTRVWLPTVDDEVVALDFSFPATGHDTRKPIYLVLHGLNGGSEEEYCREMANRRTADGSTVAVMVARGLMDLPIKGWDVFHGARVDDVHAAASTLRPVLGKRQILAGVGFSMGAIVLNNYIARSGKGCALDAAVTISGGLDCLPQLSFQRAQRLWQPMLAQELREKFVIGKFGERYKKRLTRQQMLELMRATHITVSLTVLSVLDCLLFVDVEDSCSPLSLSEH